MLRWRLLACLTPRRLSCLRRCSGSWILWSCLWQPKPAIELDSWRSLMLEMRRAMKIIDSIGSEVARFSLTCLPCTANNLRRPKPCDRTCGFLDAGKRRASRFRPGISHHCRRLPGLAFSAPPPGAVSQPGRQALAPAFFYGQTTRPSEIYASGPFRTVGVNLPPGTPWRPCSGWRPMSSPTIAWTWTCAPRPGACSWPTSSPKPARPSKKSGRLPRICWRSRGPISNPPKRAWPTRRAVF